MRRRDFLYNTGLLFPALLAAPARLLASQTTIKTDRLIIHPETNAFNLSIESHQLTGKQLKHLAYMREGFLVTTRDNIVLQTPTIILPAALLTKAQPDSITIDTGHCQFHLNFAAAKAQYTTMPEVWCYQRQQFESSQPNKMLTRKKHALILLSN